MTLVTPPKRRPTVTHLKRSGTHRKHTKQYIKPYWPYLPLLAIAGVGLVLSNLWGGPKSGVLGDQSDFSAQTLLIDTNAERSADHEASLTLDSALTHAAQAKANDMVARNYWSHNTPDGKTPWTFMTAAGYNYQKAGENLAYGFNDAHGVIVGWMHSQEHRANILNSSYQNVGFGVATSSDYNHAGPATLVVAMYGEPAGNTAQTIAFTAGPTTSPADTAPTDTRTYAVSRAQLLANGSAASWSVALLSVLALAGLGLLVLRHARYWHRTLVRSEAFIIHHPLLDIVIVSAATLSFILTRVGGYIQ